MITGDIKNKVDQLWNTFWSGGIEFLQQHVYLTIAHLEILHQPISLYSP